MGAVEHPMFQWGPPADTAATAALVLAGLVLVFRPAPPNRRWMRLALVVLAAAACLLSFGYYFHYLGGSPRVIDATAYLLEARSFARGSFSFPFEGPSGSFRGRFLIHPAGDSQALAGIFPPGYPALLSLGVLGGHPEWVGPLLAAGLVACTYQLALRVTGRRSDALLAALLSALNAALRYHTAETMAHGWSTLLTVAAVLSTCQISSNWRASVLAVPRSGVWEKGRHWLVLGFCLGTLLATRQLTGLVVIVACGISLWLARSGSRPYPLRLASLKKVITTPYAWMALAASLPAIVLLLAHHQAITGSIFSSPQLRYYSLADGPGACFGWGLGKGCAFEHAAVVAEQGGNGLTPWWALLNTVHRLHWHSLDIANCEPLAAFALYFSWKKRRDRRFWPLYLVIVLLPVAYSLFYFNGSYPGGGARFFCALLPLWHVILASGLRCYRKVRWGIALCLLGFSLHGVYSHKSLQKAHFGPSSTALASLLGSLDPSSPPRLVAFSSAHHFNLASGASPALIAVRNTGDDRLALLRDRMPGSPLFAFEAERKQPLVPLFLAPTAKTLSFEAEFEYPALDATGVWVHPESLPFSCVSRGRALALHRESSHSPGSRPANPQLSVELPWQRRQRVEVGVHWVEKTGRCRFSSWGTHWAPGQLQLDLTRIPQATHLDRLVLRPPKASTARNDRQRHETID